jgi:hypothetical protein
LYRIFKKYANSGFSADNIVMFKGEIFQLIRQVVTSWQVIAVSIALILFLNLVFYTAREYHSPRVKKVKVKKKKPEAAPPPETEAEPEIIED